jgi:hypothetical protein
MTPKTRMRTITAKDRVVQARLFIDLGFKDYLGARVLLNKKLVLQGAILASSSVEKYFKAIVALRGNVAPGHLKKAHLASVENYDPKYFAKINQSFLKMLQLVYDLRYLDNPQKPKRNFTITLERRPILAELDAMVIDLQQKFKFGQGDQILRSHYEHMVDSKDFALWENNHILNKVDKNEFLPGTDVIYAIRIDEDLGLLEVYYETDRVSFDGDFLKPGLAKSGDP